MVDALRTAVGADAFVEKLTPAPKFDGAAVVVRLIAGARLAGSVHPARHRRSAGAAVLGALSQLELLLTAGHPAPGDPGDPPRSALGLHRYRLAGELNEVRAADLRFTFDEARELLATAGITLSERSPRASRRTEGWAAGLRLAALSLAGHPDPERFVAEFSGSERTVADYLLAEVLQREPQPVATPAAHLDPRTGERIARGRPRGRPGSERILLGLEHANAFIVSIDPERTWFRYHRLFSDLLRLELRRTEPRDRRAAPTAAAWLEEHGLVTDAIRHAQAATDWPLAAPAGRRPQLQPLTRRSGRDGARPCLPPFRGTPL